MCIGSFAGVKGKDQICVQAMDGRLSVFEGGRASFTIALPGVLVPGPLCYIPKLDSFVTSNSKFDIVCYNYQHLASVAASAPAVSATVSSKKSSSNGKDQVRVLATLCSRRPSLADLHRYFARASIIATRVGDQHWRTCKNDLCRTCFPKSQRFAKRDHCPWRVHTFLHQGRRRDCVSKAP